MDQPVYVIYELIIRLQELNPEIGEYLNYRDTETGILVRTTSGTIELTDAVLLSQFNNPTSISQHEILSILDTFRIWQQKLTYKFKLGNVASPDCTKMWCLGVPRQSDGQNWGKSIMVPY